MSGERFILTVVGKDHPGIVAGISEELYEYGCNIQELNQAVLSDEFAMILLLQTTGDISIDDLNKSLKKRCKELKVNHSLRKATVLTDSYSKPSKDIIIITVIGSDKIGIVAGVTKILADMDINIVELSAEPYAIEDVAQYSVVARVEVDENIDMIKLKSLLDERAKELAVEIDIQNQEIFRAMHKI